MRLVAAAGLGPETYPSVHSNPMEAGKVRQSKAAQQTGQQSSAAKGGKGGAESASESHQRSRLQSERLALVSSVSWLSTPSVAFRALAAIAGGLVLRLWMMSAFPQTGGDALIYGNIAKNILQHGQFALTDGSGVIHPTLIRLPGYPIFLAVCFRVFGVDNYTAVAWLQIALELIACLLLADFVRRIWSSRAGLNALWLAAMCPFTAVYSSAPLTESLTFDAICLALWGLDRYLSGVGRPRVRLGWLAIFTGAVSSAALLRPDGALLAFALWPALLLAGRSGRPFKRNISVALVCGVVSVLPFVIWTGRNWSTFKVFEPLAPRYANDPGEDPHLGWQHWVKTWCLDFTCTSEIYWNVPDSTIATDDLPGWAFDSAQQHEETFQIFEDYNRDPQLVPALDARFEALARERAAAHPLRTHILLPLGRWADMTFRPRVENLTIDLRWWEYWNHKPETRFSVGYGLLNLILVGLGLAGFCYRPRYWQYFAAYLILRSLLLMTIEAPETRYTLEFFPILFALGGITLQQVFRRRSSPQ